MVSAPFCAKLLAELGADVVKVEPPDGDPARRRGPFPDGVSHPESSGLFLFANQGKRSITLDTATDAGVVRLHRLLETADIFVENQPYAGLHKVGISAEQLAERHPRLIAVSISPYGRTGDYREYAGYDLQVNALSGMSFGTGHTHREPLTTPDQQAAFLAGVGGAFAAIVALLARDAAEADGRWDAGQYVDVADSGIIATLLTGYHLPTFIYRGIAGSRSGNRMRLGLFPNCVLPCRDGYVCIDAPQLEQYQRFLNLLGNPGWTEDPRYRDRRAMSDQYPEEAESLIAPWFKEHDKDEILQLCLENRIPCAPVLTMDEVLESPHLLARRWFREIDHPRVGTLKYPGPPVRLHGSPLKVSGPAPMLGEHNDDALADPAARRPPKPRVAPRESSGDRIPPAALHDVRIVDLGSAWAGPMAGQLLADMGAEVIKVESRARMDGMRLGRPMVGEDLAGGDRGLWPELQPVFHGLNRNKLSVTLNLRTGEGRSLLRRLASVSDVVLSNFLARRPATVGHGLRQPEQSQAGHHRGGHARFRGQRPAARYGGLRAHHTSHVGYDEPGGLPARQGGAAGGRITGGLERHGGGHVRRAGSRGRPAPPQPHRLWPVRGGGAPGGHRRTARRTHASAADDGANADASGQRRPGLCAAQQLPLRRR